MRNAVAFRCVAALLMTVALANVAGATRGGTIILAGGGDLGPEILNRFQLEAQAVFAGTRHPPVILIPTAIEGEHPSTEEAAASTFLSKMGMRVTILHTRNHDVANSKAFLEVLKKGRVVWIAGGQPQLLISAYSGTRVGKELKGLLDRGGVIAGDSAGASFLASFLVCRPCEGPPVLSLNNRGLGILPQVAVDPHLTARDRSKDLPQLLMGHRGFLGVGIDENTAAVIQGGILEVIGSGIVAIYKPDSKAALDRRYSLSAGGRFNWNDREPVER